MKKTIYLFTILLMASVSVQAQGFDGASDAREAKRQREIRRQNRLDEQKKEKERNRIERARQAKARQAEKARQAKMIAVYKSFGWGKSGNSTVRINCARIVKTTTIRYDDGSKTLTVTRDDGSTQNYDEGPSGRVTRLTGGSDDHGNFVGEAKDGKTASGRTEVGRSSTDFR